jgi:MFS family permease
MSEAGASQPPSSATAPLRWIVPLLATQICIHLVMAGARLAVPLATLNLGGTTAQVGVLLALFSAASVFLALPAGRYADRHGVRRPVQIAVLLAVLGAGAMAAYPAVWMLVFAAVGTGVAVNFGLVAVQRHAGRRAAAEERKAVFSWLAIGPALSNFLGPVLAGFLFDHLGVRWCFAVLAAIPLASLLLVRFTQDDEPAAPGNRNAVGNEPAWELLADPGVRRLFFVNWLLSMSWDVHTFVVPLLGHDKGLSASVIGLVMGGFALTVTLVRVVIPFIAARMDERRVLVLSMLFTGLIFAAYPFSTGAWTMGALSCLLGMALGCVQPMILSALHTLTPEHRHGEALGLRLMLLNASGTVMPMVFGSVGAAAGVSLVFWLAGAAVAAGARSAQRLSLEGAGRRPPPDEPA